MRLLISIFAVFLPIGGLAIVHLAVYAVSVSAALRLNRWVSTVFAHRIFSVMSTYLGFRFEGNKESLSMLPERYLVIANHQSLLDIPLLMRYLDGSRLRFVAKEELARHVPLVSRILLTDKHCVIPRKGSPSRAMRIMDDFADRVLEREWIPVIFPEGTRSRDGSLGTFHAAGFRRFLDKAPMHVAVCAIEGGWKVGSLKGIARGTQGGKYRVEVLKVFSVPIGKAEQMTILEEGKALIQKKLDEWRALEL